MTPAVNALRKTPHTFLLHEYTHDPAAHSYGLEAADALQLDPARVFKTLLVMLDANPRQMAVGILPVTHSLDMKAIAKGLGVKKAEMADPKQAERMTGYVLGGISPLGQKKRLPTLLDESALGFETVFVSGGRRGLEIELSPASLVQLCSAAVVALCR